MDSIRIDTGVKKILINDGPDYIEFNPNDVIFAEKFYELIGDFENKLTEYQERSKIIDANKEVDEYGIPKNAKELMELTHEACDYLRQRIDYLFGDGTSQKVFGNVLNLDVFTQFFEGITPFIKAGRTAKMKKYMKQVNDANLRKQVLKSTSS
jgi:hypothetical protein